MDAAPASVLAVRRFWPLLLYAPPALLPILSAGPLWFFPETVFWWSLSVVLPCFERRLVFMRTSRRAQQEVYRNLPVRMVGDQRSAVAEDRRALHRSLPSFRHGRRI